MADLTGSSAIEGAKSAASTASTDAKAAEFEQIALAGLAQTGAVVLSSIATDLISSIDFEDS